ncbi:MAG: TfuA-like protein [Chloroflexi bacterium]|nr:TfuA-like protein [Chloroflexota bacterium]
MTHPTIFLGPTLDLPTAQAILPADYRPPAALGDVLHALSANPSAILLVDGLFERQPAVWHKELLWAMHHGVPVWGASSMGALRAAELAPLGMVGIGWVYEQFASGALEADDEVAVRHLPAELGYRATTEALVNIRATLAHAQAQGVIGSQTAETLLGRARALHYSQRTYERLLADGDEGGETAVLRRHLPDVRVDQKRADAITALERLANGDPIPPPPSIPFAHTPRFERLLAQETPLAISAQGVRVTAQMVAMHLCLAGEIAALPTDPRLLVAELDQAGRLAAVLAEIGAKEARWTGQVALDVAGLRVRYGQMRGRVLPPLPHLAAEMGFGRPDLFLLEFLKFVT